MSWLLPIAVIPHKGRVRSIGEIDKDTRRRERHRRWALSPQGRAWLKAYESDPKRKAMMKVRRQRWLAGPTGQAWMKANRERRNAYQRHRYQLNLKNRREYLNAKQREYRAAKKGVSA